MGDGRYYTYSQFFDVVILTTLITLAIINTLYCYYRNNEEGSTWHVNGCYGLVLFFIMFRIVESVIPNMTGAAQLRHISVVFLLASISLEGLRRFMLMKYKKVILLISLAIMLIFAVSDLMILDYGFHSSTYTLFYKVVLTVTATTISILNVPFILKQLKTMSSKAQTKWRLRLGLFILPAVVYTIGVWNNSSTIDYLEYLVVAGLTINLIFELQLGSQSALSILAFDKIGDMTSNYIIVVDTQEQVIYENEAVRKSDFFKASTMLNTNKIEEIFEGDEVKKTQYYKKEYLQLIVDETEQYFTYKISMLSHNNKVIGKIISFTRITDLMTLLMELEEKKKASQLINQQLSNYSEVVYYIEKEKEVDNLLNNILTSRDQQMKELLAMISETKGNIDETTFESYINASIQMSDGILEEVRQTVSDYRAYYGG